MKPVQILMDEELLDQMDADAEVERQGRSAVIRRLVARFLEKKREAAIDSQYRSGYTEAASVAEELEGWGEEGAWPDE
jgi:metal-responsive CopG/Arc/MetJ family transcriptional regulator